MGISIVEFRAAMKIYGAKELPNARGSRTGSLVPCYAIGDVKLLHSGSYYVVSRGGRISDEIINQAMAEFGEKYPGGDNFWYGEVHSVKGILTLAAMLDGKYSKELVNNLANETYKILLDCCPEFKHNVDISDDITISPELKKLCKKLSQFDNAVNPFGNNLLHIKKPIEYLDKLALQIFAVNDYNSSFSLRSKSSEIDYCKDSDGLYYNTVVPTQKNRKNGLINMIHYFKDGDEVIYLDYNADRSTFQDLDDIDLRISLKTGLAWQTYREEQAAPATDEQISVMITHLNICIKKIKQNIIGYMTDK